MKLFFELSLIDQEVVKVFLGVAVYTYIFDFRCFIPYYSTQFMNYLFD